MSEKQAKRNRRATRREQTRGSTGQLPGVQPPLWGPHPADPLAATGAAQDSPAPPQARTPRGADFSHLALALSAAVPLQVWDFYLERGPSMLEIEEGRAFGRVLAERGDRLLYRSSTPGESGDMFADLARALAAVSFVVPGGFPHVFGERYDAVEILAKVIGDEAAGSYCREIIQRYEADLPRVCATVSIEGEEREAGAAITCDVTPWFELSSDAEILRLRDEDYASPPQGVQCQQGEESAAALLVGWAAARVDAIAALFAQAGAQGRTLTCRVDAEQAAYWCFVHRRRLLAKKPEPAEGHQRV